MSQGVLSGFPTCGLGAGLSWTESPFLWCGGGVSAWVLWLSFCASLDLLVVEGLLQVGGQYIIYMEVGPESRGMMSCGCLERLIWLGFCIVSLN